MTMLAATVLSGCSQFPTQGDVVSAGRGIGHDIATDLVAQIPVSRRPASVVVAPANLLGQDAATSFFGQSVSDEVSSGLVRNGVRVIDGRVRFRGREFGESIPSLTYEQAKASGAAGFVTGHYSYDGTAFRLHYRIVNTADATIIAATDRVVRNEK